MSFAINLDAVAVVVSPELSQVSTDLTGLTTSVLNISSTKSLSCAAQQNELSLAILNISTHYLLPFPTVASSADKIVYLPCNIIQQAA